MQSCIACNIVTQWTKALGDKAFGSFVSECLCSFCYNVVCEATLHKSTPFVIYYCLLFLSVTFCKKEAGKYSLQYRRGGMCVEDESPVSQWIIMYWTLIIVMPKLFGQVRRGSAGPVLPLWVRTEYKRQLLLSWLFSRCTFMYPFHITNRRLMSVVVLYQPCHCACDCPPTIAVMWPPYLVTTSTPIQRVSMLSIRRLAAGVAAVCQRDLFQYRNCFDPPALHATVFRVQRTGQPPQRRRRSSAYRVVDERVCHRRFQFLCAPPQRATLSAATRLFVRLSVHYRLLTQKQKVVKRSKLPEIFPLTIVTIDAIFWWREVQGHMVTHRT